MTAQTPAGPPATPVGSWTATVVRPAGTLTCTLRFAAGGRARLAGTADPPGTGPAPAGAGSWSPTGPDQFRFRIVEPLHDPAGRPAGQVRIDQLAVQRGDTFTSAGISTVSGPDGVVTRRVPVRVRAVRAVAGQVSR